MTLREEKTGALIHAQGLEKIYQLGNSHLRVLKGINIQIPKGTFTILCGPSGSGKTTLLNIIGGVDRPSSGKIIVADRELTKLDEDALSDYRCSTVGFVFQSYNLVSTLTVAENVAFPMEWTKKLPATIENRVTELLKTVGLENRANHFPAQLSGGEQQRVAFARALANDPPIILADEPTGNLDAKNAHRIVQVLQFLKKSEKTLIVSTHDMQIRELADQVFCLEEGSLVNNND